MKVEHIPITYTITLSEAELRRISTALYHARSDSDRSVEYRDDCNKLYMETVRAIK